MKAKTLFDTVAFRLAEVEDGKLFNILSDVEEEILVDTLADRKTHRAMCKPKQ